MTDVLQDFKCPGCQQVGFHICIDCGKAIVREECESNNGLCESCYKEEE